MPEEDPGGILRVPQLQGRTRVVAGVGVFLVVVVGLVLRFDTRSALWLDEALTVNISSLPLHAIPGALRHDGAPPAYYVLLHFWMSVFGTSDLATRALAGVIGVATLPVAWLAGRRLGGPVTAWVVLVLVASAPFAIFYSTEARMYSLVILLTGLGFLALHRGLAEPRAGNLVATAVVTALLLYTQYWGLYLVAATALWMFVLVVVLRHRGGDDSWKRPAKVLAALAVGVLAFAPWVPTFLYQSKHTGTPWGTPANFAALTNAVTGFTANQGVQSATATNQGRVLSLIYFALAALALFGVGRSTRLIELDLHTRSRGRGLTFAVVVTLLLAITGGLLSSSTFSSRYAAVVFLPVLLLVGLGATTLLHPKGRAVLVAVAVAAGLAISFQNVNTQRTQAPEVATVLNTQARPGDVIAFCPDQLGPSVQRLLVEPERYELVTYPRGTGPRIVDWVDYAQAVQGADPGAFATHLLHRAGPSHSVWLVWEPGYQTYGLRCELIAGALQAVPGRTTTQRVTADTTKYYEPMNLTEYAAAGT
jgi:uncharacterized membrane protein